MKQRWPVLAFSAISLGLVLLFARCTTVEKRSAQPSANWINNMHRLSTTYLVLMPLASDPKKFSSPENQQVIRDNLTEFAKASAQLAKDPQAPNADPVIEYTSTRFGIDGRQALAAFELGDHSWSRYALGHMTDYCINCHTRSNRGARDFPINWSLQLSGLPASQRIEMLLANRQYASALRETKALIAAQKAPQQDPRAWQVTVEKVMAMVIRADHSSDEAMALALAVMNDKTASFYIRNDAAQWVRDIQNWKKERPPKNDREKFKLAESLVGKASLRRSMSANLIPALRASGLLHELLENTKSADHPAYLYQAGLVAQSLRDINLGYLDQFYFESCIRDKPHSDLAEECFVQLQTSVSATNLFIELEPDSAYSTQSRLADLRKLAEVKDPELAPGWRNHPWDYDFDDKGKPEPKGGR